MKGTFKVIWTEEALDGLKAIIQYLKENWTSRELGNFSELIDKRVKLIISNPGLSPFANKKKSVRKSVLSKNTSIYYKVDGENIYLLSIFDNRQNPNKLKL